MCGWESRVSEGQRVLRRVVFYGGAVCSPDGATWQRDTGGAATWYQASLLSLHFPPRSYFTYRISLCIHLPTLQGLPSPQWLLGHRSACSNYRWNPVKGNGSRQMLPGFSVSPARLNYRLCPTERHKWKHCKYNCEWAQWIISLQLNSQLFPPKAVIPFACKHS